MDKKSVKAIESLLAEAIRTQEQLLEQVFDDKISPREYADHLRYILPEIEGYRRILKEFSS